MDIDDAVEAHAFGASGADVVGAEVFEEAVAGEQRQGREGTNGHAGQRQHGVLEPSAPSEAIPGEALGREPAKLEAEDLQQGHGEDIAWN